MARDPSITSEQLRLYHALVSTVGRKTADELYPHIARFVARLDAGGPSSAHLSSSRDGRRALGSRGAVDTDRHADRTAGTTVKQPSD